MGIHKSIAGTVCLIASLAIFSIAQAGFIGNEINDRTSNDTWYDFTTVDTSLEFTENGRIKNWSIWSGGSGEIYLQVFRSLGNNQYQIVGENYFSDVVEGLNTWSVDTAKQIEVMAGDYIGFSMNSSAAHIDFDYDDSGNLVYHSDDIGSWVTGIGETATLANHYQKRTYSIAAETVPTPVPEPGTIFLLGIGLAAIAKSRRFRKNNKE